MMVSFAMFKQSLRNTFISRIQNAPFQRTPATGCHWFDSDYARRDPEKIFSLGERFLGRIRYERIDL